jgi:hypothetical protein
MTVAPTFAHAAGARRAERGRAARHRLEEMSRGLLVQWGRLEDGEHDTATARITRYHVLGPNEWNRHSAGEFGQLVAAAAFTPGRARLAAATLDPCIEFDIEGATEHA